MKILLIDVDSTIVNLALAKISTYHKQRGDDVILQRLHVPYYPTKKKAPVTIDLQGYDKAYVSSIFKGSVNNDLGIVNESNTEIFVGGTGVPDEIPHGDLPEEIAKCEVDYSLWPDNNVSYGFITRGCIRKCWFCVVPTKEGKIRFESHPKDIIKHNQVRFLDNNFLAYPGHIELLQWLKDNQIRYQFNQGLDIRLLTVEAAVLLAGSRYQEEITFAFDDVKYESIINNKMAIINEHLGSKRCRFFIYTHPSQPLRDILYRVIWCRQNQALPYLMRDIACWGSEYSDFYVDLAARCNQPNLFKKMPFSEYIMKRQAHNRERESI